MTDTGDSKPIEVDYHITVRDYRQCQRVLSSAVWPPRLQKRVLGRGIWGWVLFAALLMMLYALMRRGDTTVQPDQLSRIIEWSASVIIVVLLGFLLWIISLIRKKFARITGKVILSDAGMDHATEHTRTHTEWSQWQQWVESEDLIILIFMQDGRRNGHYFPKRLFTSDDLERVRQLLARQIGSPVAAA